MCSDDPCVNEHVLRRVQEQISAGLNLAWVQSGVQRYTTRDARVSRHEARALIGFLDGTSNLEADHSTADARLVFVDPGDMGNYPPKQADNSQREAIRARHRTSRICIVTADRGAEVD